jgi:subtilisin family serine protease
LDEDGDQLLDTEAGHGTFIGGLVQRLRPGMATEQQRVLSPAGLGDDFTVTVGLVQSSAPVLNLSLGGYTRGNRRPPALLRAIRALGRDRVVVAAAGNNSSCRPFWPAALPGVVAVAAYDTRGGHAASFTNYGPWVDVMAPGVDLRSVYVYGTRDDGAGQVPFEGWASWSGTSFAAPVVAAEIAARALADPGRSPSDLAVEFLASLPVVPWPGLGRWYDPGVALEE